jgi:hypothetical protein
MVQEGIGSPDVRDAVGSPMVCFLRTALLRQPHLLSSSYCMCGRKEEALEHELRSAAPNQLLAL